MNSKQINHIPVNPYPQRHRRSADAETGDGDPHNNHTDSQKHHGHNQHEMASSNNDHVSAPMARMTDAGVHKNAIYEDIFSGTESRNGKGDVKQRFKAEKRNVITKRKQFGNEDENENLGDDFERTPWLPPSIEKANEFKRRSMFRGGDARMDSVDIVKAADLGVGIQLYFQFTFSMSIILVVMSILALPALVLFYNGEGVPIEYQDSFGLYKYTLGNMGYDTTSPTYHIDSKCQSSRYGSNETCIQYGAGNEMSISEASSVLTAFEFLQIAVFFVGILHLYRITYSSDVTLKTETSLCNYAVVVSNIPPDTTKAEVLKHFSSLYQLSKTDWRGRPAMAMARPVAHSDNSGDPGYVGTWVAECVIHKEVGVFISSFRDQQHLMEKLKKCRAKMKMYAENTPRAGGHDLKQFKKAEIEMLKTAKLIDYITAKNLRKQGLKIIMNESVHVKNGIGTHDIEQGKSGGGNVNGGNGGLAVEVGGDSSSKGRAAKLTDIYSNIDAKAVVAFVCFEYNESFARCVSDYRKYSQFPYSLMLPKELQLRGHTIYVEPAPEPDQIVWENLEVPKSTKFWLRQRTTIITISLVIGAFVIILQASIAQKLFSGNIPSATTCHQVIPEIYAVHNASAVISDVELTRPASNHEKYLDAQCDDVVPGSFYGVFAERGNLDEVVGTYDTDMCTPFLARKFANSSLGGLCPHVDAPSFCPCFELVSSERCSSLLCQSSGDAGCSKNEFSAGTIGACYCHTVLINVLRENGVVGSLNRLQSIEQGICRDFFREYSVAVGLTYVSVAITVGVNVLLRNLLYRLAVQERHSFTDLLEGSIMSKVFISSYIVSTILILVAYGHAPNLPPILSTLHIFNGPYSDFNTGWYSDIGFYFMTSFIIQSFSPLAGSMAQCFVIKPLLRMYHHAHIRHLESTSKVMQHDLNMLQVGPVFDCTLHFSQLLCLLFFAMTYAPGLPLLMPLCLLSFLVYFRFDKYLLCRFNQKPPHIGSGTMKIALNYLTYAAIIRLAFACWMFSNSNILPEDGGLGGASTAQQSQQGTEAASTTTRAGAGTWQQRITRNNVLPLFLLLALIVAAKVVMYLIENLPIWTFLRMLLLAGEHIIGHTDTAFPLHALQKGGEVHPWELLRHSGSDPLRQEAAPFTGTYFRYLKHKDEIPDTCCKMFTYYYLTQLTEQETIDGWEVADDGDFVIKIKKWHDNETSDGALVNRRKKTFEIIGDNRCNSYNIEKVPAYALAMEALKSGTASILDFQHKLLMEKNVMSDEYDLYGTSPVRTSIIEKYNMQHQAAAAVVAHSKDAGTDSGTMARGFSFENDSISAPVKAKPQSVAMTAPPPAAAAGRRVAVDNSYGAQMIDSDGEYQYRSGADTDTDVGTGLTVEEEGNGEGGEGLDTAGLYDRPVSRHTALKQKILKQKGGGKKGHHHNHHGTGVGAGGGSIPEAEERTAGGAAAPGYDYEEEVDMTPGVYDENDWREGASGLV